jgi:hypothetical protein
MDAHLEGATNTTIAPGRQKPSRRHCFKYTEENSCLLIFNTSLSHLVNTFKAISISHFYCFCFLFTFKLKDH